MIIVVFKQIKKLVDEALDQVKSCTAINKKEDLDDKLDEIANKLKIASDMTESVILQYGDKL